MLFVLSTLLGCKRKSEIQNNLAKQGIIQEMNKYFEYNEWGNIFEENPRPFFNNQEINYSDDTAFHGEGCKCDQEVGFKVQYLRFIYSFCCRDNDNTQNKLSLFSRSDLEDTFANSYFYYFYFYMYLNKFKMETSIWNGNKFSSLCEKIFLLEKNSSNAFLVFFDYLYFLNLFENVQKINDDKDRINLKFEKQMDFDNYDYNKDSIMSEINYSEKKNASTFDFTESINNKANKNLDGKNLTFITTKIAKNHFNKGVSGK